MFLKTLLDWCEVFKWSLGCVGSSRSSGGRFHEFHCFVLIFISVWEVCLKKDQGLGVFIDIKMVLDSYSFFDE